jgi:AbrB family looped-hinge helix DNA binding protein
MNNHTNHTRGGKRSRGAAAGHVDLLSAAAPVAPDAPEVYGTATVGERGQIVIPQPAREKYGISPGDRLVVIGGAFGANALLLVRADVMGGLLAETVQKLVALRESVDTTADSR